MLNTFKNKILFSFGSDAKPSGMGPIPARWISFKIQSHKLQCWRMSLPFDLFLFTYFEKWKVIAPKERDFRTLESTLFFTSSNRCFIFKIEEAFQFFNKIVMESKT